MIPSDAAARSTNPADYQTLPRRVAAMAKSFDDGFSTARHAHTRDQLLFAIRGVMTVRTSNEAWIVPPDRAVYVPAGVMHTVTMKGPVAMRTLFIAPGADVKLPTRAMTIEVSLLLSALILALLAEPMLYDETARGGTIAALIIDEILLARHAPLAIQMPHDQRLYGLCAAILADPADDRTLEQWSQEVPASARTLARLFDAEIGLSFSVWRQRVRFHAAVEGLVRGDPVSRIARACGYRSASAFSAAFRKHMGYSPTTLRAPSRQGRSPV